MNICVISDRLSGQNRIFLLGFQNMCGGCTLNKGNSTFLILQSPQGAFTPVNSMILKMTREVRFARYNCVCKL